MYGWSGSDPGTWRGSGKYDYGAARARYDTEVAKSTDTQLRVYVMRKEPDMELVDPKGKFITSDSENPAILGIDITGSMSIWPSQIFDRIPLFYQTLSKYKPDFELCVGAIGDTTSNNFPLQMNSFGKSLDLEKKIKALGCEGKGGDTIEESYELFGYYMLNHINTPKAKKPFLIIMGDEKCYSIVNPKDVRAFTGDIIKEPIDSKEIWTKLNEKYRLYFLQKPYGSGRNRSITKEIKSFWEEMIGEQRVLEIPSMERAVDVAMGLIAKTWGQYDDFSRNLDARQDDIAVKRAVHNSLKNIVEESIESVKLPEGSKINRRLF